MFHHVGGLSPFAAARFGARASSIPCDMDGATRLPFALDIARMYIWERDMTSRKVERFGNPDAVLGVHVDTIDDFLAVVHHHDRPIVAEAIETVIARSEPYEIEFRVVRADGSHVWLRDVGRRMIADGQDRFIGVCIDVTSEVEARMRATRLASYDSLTGLANRRQIREWLDAAVESYAALGKRVAVLCLDLDGFKAINDRYGHKTGDELLLQVAQALTDCCDPADLVGRVGGDEFVIILPGSASARCDAIASRIIGRLSQPFMVDQHHLYVGVSIGAALVPRDGRHTETLLHRADLALYQAKASGRGRLCYYQAGMDLEARRLRRLESDLRRALMLGQLSLVYQPLIAADTGRTEGVEALMRWHHPELGAIGPDEFIGIAETTGLIIALGEWALHTACTAALDWADLKVAVNVSAVQFRHPGFMHSIRTVLADTGLAPGRLELEITENVLLYGAEEAIGIFGQLKSLGVTIAIDDFGTGYSSLSYLSRFAFDRIKIDGSFIQSLEQLPESAAIVRAVLNLGRSLDIAVTAEGVETSEQMTFLTGEGCRHFQGFLFCEPVSSGAIIERLASEAPDHGGSIEYGGTAKKFAA